MNVCARFVLLVHYGFLSGVQLTNAATVPNRVTLFDANIAVLFSCLFVFLLAVFHLHAHGGGGGGCCCCCSFLSLYV